MIPNAADDLVSVTGFAAWRAAIEKRLTDLDARIAGLQRSGEMVVWPAGPLPSGLLQANGALLNRATYPGLFAAIGTTFNTGGETGAQFRLPNVGGAPVGVWAIRT